MTTSLNHATARVICGNALDVADARRLFEILGLVDGPDGRELLPDDTRPIPMGDMGQTPAKANPWSPIAVADHGRRPENCTTPPGLRDLPPLPVVAPKAKPRRAAKAPAAKPTRRRAPRPPVASEGKRPRVAVCGTTGGYSRHVRLGESICDPCRDAKNAYWRDRDADRRAEQGRAISDRQKVAQCGTRSGYARHLRLGEPTCDACRAANTRRQQKATAETKRLVAAGVNAQTASVLGERAGVAS